MKKWLDYFRKKPVPMVEEPEELIEDIPVKVVKNTLAPLAADYPKAEYTAFWETIVIRITNGYRATVRFYSWNPPKGVSALLDTSSYEAPDEETAKKLAWRAIPVKMDKYKR